MKSLLAFSENFLPSRVIEIKLRDLLSLRHPDALLRQINICFPPVGIGSVTLVDQIVLLCLEELVHPRKIIEIGTFQGFTTALLVNNSNAERIFSVDLPKAESNILATPDFHRVLADGHYNDDYLRDLQNASGEVYLKALDERSLSRITLVKADSTSLNFRATFGDMEFAFIDGGHDYDVVQSDTNQVLDVIKQGVIVWHDYASGIHSDVTRFLSEHAKENLLFHVSGSLCAFQIVH